ncbi:unnamed protein product [Lota lota]
MARRLKDGCGQRHKADGLVDDGCQVAEGWMEVWLKRMACWLDSMTDGMYGCGFPVAAGGWMCAEDAGWTAERASERRVGRADADAALTEASKLDSSTGIGVKAKWMKSSFEASVSAASASARPTRRSELFPLRVQTDRWRRLTSLCDASSSRYEVHQVSP